VASEIIFVVILRRTSLSSVLATDTYCLAIRRVKPRHFVSDRVSHPPEAEEASKTAASIQTETPSAALLAYRV
jgi:hypothetical protein